MSIRDELPELPEGYQWTVEESFDLEGDYQEEILFVGISPTDDCPYFIYIYEESIPEKGAVIEAAHKALKRFREKWQEHEEANRAREERRKAYGHLLTD